MRLTLRSLSLVLFCLCPAACTTALPQTAEQTAGQVPPQVRRQTPASTIDTAGLRQRIADYFGPLADTADFSGTIRVERDGQLLTEQYFGLADVEAGRSHTSGTLYSAASVTKGILAATLVSLEEEGLLSLTDRVSRFLPDLSAYPQMTLESVLRHEAGLPRDFPAGLSPQSQPGGVAGWLAAAPGRISEAGTHAYSNVGYALLAELIAAATGERFAVAAEEQVLLPAGMTDSFISARDADAFAGGARPYTAGPQPSGVMTPIPAGLETGSSGLITTSADLSIWVRTLASGRYRRLFETEDPLGSIDVGQDGGGHFVSVQGSLPGYAAGAITWPEQGLTISYASNLFSYPVIGLNSVLRAIMFDDMPPPPPRRPEATALTEAHLALAGDYIHPDFGHIMIAADTARGGLFLSMPERERYWNFYLTPLADGALHWRAFNTVLAADGSGGLKARQKLAGSDPREFVLTRK